MDPKLNPKLKRILSNPEFGKLVTDAIIKNNNKISKISILLTNIDIELELTPIGYTGKQSNSEDSKK